MEDNQPFLDVLERIAIAIESNHELAEEDLDFRKEQHAASLAVQAKVEAMMGLGPRSAARPEVQTPAEPEALQPITPLRRRPRH